MWSWGWGVCNFHLPWGRWAKTGDAVTEEWVCATGTSWVEARGAAQHPAMPRKAPRNKGYRAQSAEVEKPCVTPFVLNHISRMNKPHFF